MDSQSEGAAEWVEPVHERGRVIVSVELAARTMDIHLCFRTTASIAGEDFVVSASDSRISLQDINVVARDVKKTYIM